MELNFCDNFHLRSEKLCSCVIVLYEISVLLLQLLFFLWHAFRHTSRKFSLLHCISLSLLRSCLFCFQASSLGGIVIVERTQISDQYFLPVQKLVVLELGMVLLPVANQGEASQLITQLVSFYDSGQTSSKIWHLRRMTCFPKSSLISERILGILKEWKKF